MGRASPSYCDRCSEETRRPRAAVCPPRPRNAGRRQTALAVPGRRGDQPPLRRGERLLPAGARSEHDLLVRALRRPARTTLEEAQAAKHELICRKLGLHRSAGRPAARRRLRLGLDGHPRRPRTTAMVTGVALSPSRSRRRDGRVEEAGLAGPGRDPAAGLPRPPRRALRRHLVDRHVRARGQAQMMRYFETLRRLLDADRAAAQPRHLEAGRNRDLGPAHLHRPLRVPRRRAARRRRGRPGHAAHRLRGTRRRIAARALLTDPPPLGGQPGGRAGTRRSRWSGLPGPTSGASTWRRRPTGSTTAASPSTRCSAWSPTATAQRHATRPRTGWG